jgi:S-adenosylmethionine/arginine decarboxylase-like enzyme
MDNNYAGWHLTYDAVVNPEKSGQLGDVVFLKKVFLDLVELLDMKVLVAPTFKTVPLEPAKMGGTLEDDGGVTGTCIITTSHLSIHTTSHLSIHTTSHLSIHTWPLRHRFALDVFSCKEFSSSATDEFLQSRFNVKIRSSHWIVRHWP